MNNLSGQNNQEQNVKYIDKMYQKTIDDVIDISQQSALRLYNVAGVPLRIYGKQKKKFGSCKKYGCNGLGNIKTGYRTHRSAKYCPKSIKPLFDKSVELLEKSSKLAFKLNQLKDLENLQVNSLFLFVTFLFNNLHCYSKLDHLKSDKLELEKKYKSLQDEHQLLLDNGNQTNKTFTDELKQKDEHEVHYKQHILIIFKCILFKFNTYN